MNSHQMTEYAAPHRHPEKIIIRYLESLMRLTYDHPLLMRDLLVVVGASGLALTVSPYILPVLGLDAPVSKVASVALGGALTLFSAASSFAQHRLFGFPISADFQAYQPAYFDMNAGEDYGEMIVQSGQMPLLRIKASDHYTAGYIEGSMLAPAMHDILSEMNIIFPLLSMVYGASHSTQGWPAELQGVLKHIPARFRDEMQGKVEGYNQWLFRHFPNQLPLTFDQYFLLQLLPDLRNFDIFPQHHYMKKLIIMFEGMACTTFVLRLHDQTFYNRVLDWPSHDKAGKYIYQIERSIGAIKRTCDICIPLVSGALTVLNQDGLLLQINVAHGPKISEANGMPAIFYTRYCAEEAANTNDIDYIIKHLPPLDAYHLTASNGVKTKSYHLCQNMEIEGEHAVESMADLSDEMQLLVVANQGVRFRGGIPHVCNHRDSRERMQNLEGFFYHEPIRAELAAYLRKLQNGDVLSDEVAARVSSICHEAAKVDLVNNMESVLFAQYHFDGEQLRSAKAAVNNLFAQERKPEEFKQLKI